MLHPMRFQIVARFCSIKVARLEQVKIKSTTPDTTRNNLIWLHGMFDSTKSFANLAQNEELKSITNQYLVDSRNHGFSEHTETNTFYDMSYDLVDYIANRDMKDIFLLGHSMGGRTILTAMKQHKSFLEERVKGVIIVDILPGSYANEQDSAPTDAMLLFLKEMKLIQLEGKTFSQLENEVKEKFKQDGIVTTLMNNVSESYDGTLSWRINLSALENSYDHLVKHEISECLWEGPRKVIIGAKSKFTGIEKAKFQYPSIFNDFQVERDLCVFEDSAHFLYAKEPERFINEVIQFIKDVDSLGVEKEKQRKKYLDELLTI